MDILDLTSLSDDGDRAFKAEEWIGVGKTYPLKDVPQYISAAKRAVLAVPNAKLELLPASTIPIYNLLSAVLPDHDQSEELLPLDIWFSQDCPSSDIALALQRSIPSARQLSQIEHALGQFWFDGCKSVVDKRYNEGMDRFPLWIITFWKEIARARAGQRKWFAASNWFARELDKVKDLDETNGTSGAAAAVDTLGMLREVDTAIYKVPWDSPVGFAGIATSTLQLSTFLSSEWLSDTHIDIMLQILGDELAHSKMSSHTLIATLGFSRCVSQVEEKLTLPDKKWKRGFLHRYECRIKEGRITTMYFPLHVNSNHWMVGMVNFAIGTVSYGNSLVGSSSADLPPVFHRCLILWLEKGWPEAFNSKVLSAPTAFSSIPHAIQTDSYSCGIITANTIEHNVFGRSIWVPEYATFHRAVWFLRSVACFFDDSKPPRANPSHPESIPQAAPFTQPPSQSIVARSDLNLNSQEALSLLSQLSCDFQGLSDHNFPSLSEDILRELVMGVTPHLPVKSHDSEPALSTQSSNVPKAVKETGKIANSSHPVPEKSPRKHSDAPKRLAKSPSPIKSKEATHQAKENTSTHSDCHRRRHRKPVDFSFIPESAARLLFASSAEIPPKSAENQSYSTP